MKKQLLSVSKRTILDKRLSEAEESIGAQIVLATVKRSDIHAEIPWKAFAISSSVTAFVVIIIELFRPGWVTDRVIQFSVTAILSAGVLAALLTLLLPCFARLFLSESRKETETRQYAESLFLSHQLFATEGRRGILLLVSQFERKVVIIPDSGISDRLKPEMLNSIISKMTPQLKKQELQQALETGLNELCALLGRSATPGTLKNELSNEIIEEEGK
jgi:putative membrane protein